MSLDNYDYSATELLELTRVPHPFPHLPSDAPRHVSVGMALDHIAELGKVTDLKGDCDGIDALCYHLCKSDVDNAIDVLQKVINRFYQLERNRLDRIK